MRLRGAVAYGWTAPLPALAALLAPAPAAASAQSCAAIAEARIDAGVSTLPIGEVSLDSAVLVAAADGLPELCSVIGHIAPLDPAGFPIRFQVNLPADWNGKTMQIGGGGTNGVLITGLQTPRISDGSEPPLARGYATYGTDAGHTRTEPDPQVYAWNEEAVINQAYAAYKKSRDVALAIIGRYYERPTEHNYFYGNSEGGREALMMVQRFPTDYEGVIAIVPAMNWVGQHLAHHNQWIRQRDGGWLPPVKTALLERTALSACDALDGIADGVIGFQDSCRDLIDFASLRCPGGQDSGEDCLSDPQLAFVESIYEPYRFAFPIAHGVSSYPPSPLGAEAGRGGIAGGLMVTEPPGPGDLGRPLAGPGSVRYFFAQDPGFAQAFDMSAHMAHVLKLSAWFDPTDSNIATFGEQGKLIVIDFEADYLKSPYGTAEYYESALRALGQDRADGFLRYYMLPGLSHGGTGTFSDGTAVPGKVDVLSMLERWVDAGEAPSGREVVAQSDDGTITASRPLCEYPARAVYTGSVAASDAGAYACAVDPAYRPSATP